jgi:asparaginyl-tRNA synthetase
LVFFGFFWVAFLTGKKERQAAVGGLPRLADGSIDYSKDFFGKPAFLTVSGQLEAEIYACAMTSVYTFGPTFRAENSHTTRHLAEFWMIEPEIAFCDLEGNMKCAEQYVRYCCQAVLDRCLDDLQFLASRFDKDAVDRVKKVAESSFARVSYTEAIELLQQVCLR